jgi:hypothetical protein
MFPIMANLNSNTKDYKGKNEDVVFDPKFIELINNNLPFFLNALL